MSISFDRLYLISCFNKAMPPAPKNKMERTTVLTTAIAVTTVFAALSIKTLASRGLPEGAENKALFGALCLVGLGNACSKFHDYAMLNIQKKE